MRSTIKVLVVDDSALIRQLLTRALSVDPRIEIVGVAGTGVEAIEKARDLAPDVITLDVEMPELTGIEALPYLKKHSSARVVMLSSIDDPDTTYEALSAGAVDFISKPKGGFASSLSDLSELLLKKIRIAYRIDPGRVEQATTTPAEEPARPTAPRTEVIPPAIPPTGPVTQPPAPALPALEHVVAIAASTGGPPALERVFSGLTQGLPAAFLVVQHLPAGFSTSLARRLSAAGIVEVVEAWDGAPLVVGRAYLAPYGMHTTVVETHPRDYRIHLLDSPPIHGVKPAADPLFSSVAATFGSRAVGVVLTGMGSDGATGLAEIKISGGETIAQDEETSVVWGMPGAASRVGAIRHTVPLGLVAAEIRRAVRGGVAT